MTSRTPTVTAATDRRLIRPTAEPPLRARGDHRPRRRANQSARRSTSRSSSTGRARCRARRSASPSARSGASRGSGPRPVQRRRVRRSSTSSSSPRRPRPRPAAAHRAARPIDARGSTNLGEGWLRGCEQVAGHLVEQGVNRCLLLTDGLANIGMTDPASSPATPPSCARGASRPRRSASAPTSTRSCCRRWPTPAAATSTTSRTPRRSTTTSPARSARRSRSWPATSCSRSPLEDVGIEAISPYQVRAARQPDHRLARRPRSEQVVEVVLRLTFPYGEIGRETGAILGLTDRDGVFGPGGAGEGPVGSTGPTPTIGRTTRSHAIARSTARSPGCSPPGAPGGDPPQSPGDCEGGGQILRRHRASGSESTPAHIEDAGGDRGARDLEQAIYAAPMAEPGGKRPTSPAPTCCAAATHGPVGEAGLNRRPAAPPTDRTVPPGGTLPGQRERTHAGHPAEAPLDMRRSRLGQRWRP